MNISQFMFDKKKIFDGALFSYVLRAFVEHMSHIELLENCFYDCQTMHLA